MFEFWLFIFYWVRLNNFSSFDIFDHLLLFNSVMWGKVKRNGRILIWLVRVVWLTRNDTLFNGGMKGSHDIFLVEKSLTWDWFIARSKDQSFSYKHIRMSNIVGIMR